MDNNEKKQILVNFLTFKKNDLPLKLKVNNVYDKLNRDLITIMIWKKYMEKRVKINN